MFIQPITWKLKVNRIVVPDAYVVEETVQREVAGRREQGEGTHRVVPLNGYLDIKR